MAWLVHRAVWVKRDSTVLTWQKHQCPLTLTLPLTSWQRYHRLCSSLLHRVLAPVVPVLLHHLYSLSQLHQLHPPHHTPHSSWLHFSLLQLVENPPSPSWKRFLLLSPFILPRTIGLWSLRLQTQYVYCDECIPHILTFHTAIHRLCPLICPCSKLSMKLSESRSWICHQMYYLICSPFHYLQILPTAIRTSEYQRSGQCCQPA